MKIETREDYRIAFCTALSNDLFRCNWYKIPKIFSFKKVAFVILDLFEEENDDRYLNESDSNIEKEIANDLDMIGIDMIKMNY